MQAKQGAVDMVEPHHECECPEIIETRRICRKIVARSRISVEYLHHRPTAEGR